MCVTFDFKISNPSFKSVFHFLRLDHLAHISYVFLCNYLCIQNHVVEINLQLINNAGKGNYSEFPYPFIKRASTFSSSSSSSSTSSSGGNNAYDYIVVGGGTAGCPLAATLSQNFSVLLLERGGVPFSNVNVSFLENFHIALADISPTSASQAFVSTDGVINARARVLGGGTGINAGFYTRASSR